MILSDFCDTKTSRNHSILNYFILRTNVQCSTECSLDQNCHATKWDEENQKCVMYKKDGLCLDENTSNTVSVLVEDTSICSSICQGMSKNAGLTNKF